MAYLSLDYISEVESPWDFPLSSKTIHLQLSLQYSRDPVFNRVTSSTHKAFQSFLRMYTYTPTHRFLVLSAAESGPYHPANKFLVLSPIESGPDPRAWEDQPKIETSSIEESPVLAPTNRARTNSSLSTNSSVSLNDLAATLPSGFLYLGHGKKQN